MLSLCFHEVSPSSKSLVRFLPACEMARTLDIADQRKVPLPRGKNRREPRQRCRPSFKQHPLSLGIFTPSHPRVVPHCLVHQSLFILAASFLAIQSYY